MASTSSQNNDNDNTTPTQIHNILMNYGVVGRATSSSATTTTFSATTGAEDLLQHEMKSLRKSLNLEEIEKLPYEIYRYSSFSTNYVPE